MTITSDSMKEFVLANPKLVSYKPVADNMFVLKYKRKVFYDNLWNEYLEECRGTIVDKDFNIISLPFRKIYNYGIEKKAPVLPDDTKVMAYRKVNGFMVAMTWHKGEVLVSTTGSIDSIYVEKAREFLIETLRVFIKHNPDVTHLFECVHKSDPHIIPEQEGLYYLGNRHKSWGSNINRQIVTIGQVSPVLSKYTTIGQLRQELKDCRHEGYVFYTDGGISSKFKTPYYLTQKFLARNPDTSKLMKSNVKNYVDEEYYPLVDHIKENIEEFTRLDEQARLAWIRNYLVAACI